MDDEALRAQEQARLAELSAYKIMDSGPEAVFDAIVHAATLVAGVPAGAIGLIDEARQWFKSRVGIDVQDVPREETFCRYVVEDGGPVVIDDARDDERTLASPWVVPEEGIRFYAGFPLRTPTGSILGTLCVNDTTPHQLTPEQVQVLWTLADQAMAQIELRRQAAEATAAREVAQERADLLDAVLDSIDVAVLVGDETGRPIADNAYARSLFGFGRGEIGAVDETGLVSRMPITFADATTAVPPDKLPLSRTLAGELDAQEYCVFPPDGPMRRLLVSGRPMLGPDGVVIGSVVAGHDITSVREREAELSARIRDVEALADASRAILGGEDAGTVACETVKRLCNAQHVSLMVPGGDDRLVVSATTSEAMVGVEVLHTQTSVIGEVFRDREAQFIDPEADPRTNWTAASKVADQYGRIRGALYMPLVRDDDCLGVLVMTTAHEIGKLPSRVFGLLEIMTAELTTTLERDRLRSELAAQASTDPLTGLANRRSWDERVGHAVIAAGDAPVCMAILDLDHFKAFNDTYGHQAGDLLLREASAAWSHEIRAGDLLARLGGEEFGVLLPGCSLADAMAVLNAVRLAVPQSQTVSIGVSERRPDESVSTWYARTDRALYQAKEGGRNVVRADSDPFVDRRRHAPIPSQPDAGAERVGG